MEFEYLEYEFSEGGGRGRRISSLLAENGYQSLQREGLALIQRYLPGDPGSADAPAQLERARTVDVLIPPADQTARILVCERPAAGGARGTVVAVVAVGRSQEDAHRSRTAVKIVLDSKGAAEVGLPPRAAGDNGRARVRRFRQEWVRDLGLVRQVEREDSAPAPPSRSLAAVQALFAIQDAPPLLGRPAVLRGRSERPDKMGEPGRAAVDPGLLDGLVPEGLVDRSFVLICRETGQIVGIGKDAGEVQAAMQLTLRCPHCRRPLGEESPDVLYSLSAQGEEFVRSTRWIREAVESSLRKRNCDVVLADGATARGLDGAACYQDAVLLFRVKDGAPVREEIEAFVGAAAEFEKIAPGVPVRSVYVALNTPQAADPQAVGTQAPCTVLDVSRLESGLDRLLDDIKRDNFIRLTGTTLDLVRPDPSTLVTRSPAAAS